MLRAMSRRSVIALVALVACSGGKGPSTSTKVWGDAPERFEDLAAVVANHIYRFDPAKAVSLGLHRYDGLLPDRTPAAIEEERVQLERDRDALLSHDAKTLTPLQQDERDVLLAEVRGRLFRLVDMDVARTNPMSYTPAINLDAYILRDYAPAADRAAAVIRMCKSLPGYLAQARTNLQPPMPAPWIATALLQTKGMVTFVDKDVRQTFAMITIPLANQAEIDPAIDTCKAALAEHVAWLEAQLPRGTQDFRLGTEKFLRMLAETQGVETDVARLRAMADADLARNLAAMTEAAKAIDPARPTAAVVAAMAKDQPAATDVIALATAQTRAMRQFVLDHKIASIPSDEDATVMESPAFLRYNSAFLNASGVFETRPLPSFYYISPPDPAWSAAEQAAYIPPKMDLLFTTIHEVYPGHFLQRLHKAKAPSRTLQAFCTYSNSEGWAHYTEEMMFDAGAGGGTPQARIGMLKEALLRNVRFVVALGIHTGTMTVEEATQLFADKAFVDPGNAKQQATRATFDPMYLSYTLGKLMIHDLRTAWLAAHPGATLGQFHDEFLSHGCAPIPVIRRAMLGSSSVTKPR